MLMCGTMEKKASDSTGTWAAQLLEHWLQTQAFSPARELCSEAPIIQRWQAPPHEKLKCNFDAAIFSESQQVGIGFIIRNEEGLLVEAKKMILCMGRRMLSRPRF